METPVLAPPKGDLLKRLIEQFTNRAVDQDAIELICELQYASKMASAELNQSLAKVGLSEAKFFVLIYLIGEELENHPNSNPSDIAIGIGVTRATVTGLLDGLERDGFVERRQDPHDRRGITIQVCEKGRQLLRDVAPSQFDLVLEIVGPLSRDEKRQLTLLLRKLNTRRSDSAVGCGCPMTVDAA